MDAKVGHEDPKKGLHDVRSFIGACNFCRRHIKNFTYTSAILTHLIKKSTTWRWGPQEQQAFDELKDKVANAKCLGVPRSQGGIILVTDASNVGGGGTLFQWQALEKEEFDSAISQSGTEGLNRDGPIKHSYPDDKWVLVPLGHWNWKWNQARGNYSTYEQAGRETQLEARAGDMRDPVTKRQEMALIRYNPNITEMEVRRRPDWRPRRSGGETGMEDREGDEQRDRLMARRRKRIRQVWGQDGCTVSPRRGTSGRGPEGKGQQKRPSHGLEHPGLGTQTRRAEQEAGKAKRGRGRQQCRQRQREYDFGASEEE